MGKFDEKTLKTLAACVLNARDLLESAKVVEATGKHNIAYHLATLALEEIGKRELFQMQEVARSVGDVPSWQVSAAQDHVKKLFWCFYSLGRISDMIDQKQFFEKRDSAADIHANRLAGLYVDSADDQLNVPSKAVSGRQSSALIKLAEAVIEHAEHQTPRDDVPQEELELQIWFLKAMDDTTWRKHILSKQSIERLKQFNDAPEWARWIKAKIETDERELQSLVQRELQRKPDANSKSDRWRIRFRIETNSNSIRPAALKEWNKAIQWIKLLPVQGAKSKEQLIVELTLGSDVPMAALWGTGFSLSLRFLIAINMATSGFWWWPLAPNARRFYESIRDLEKGHDLQIDTAGFRVFEQRSALTAVHMQHLQRAFSCLPAPTDPQRGQAYTFYLGGLTFVSINSIQWRCESQAFGNFLESLRLLISEASYPLLGESVDTAIGRYINEIFPDLDASQYSDFLDLIRSFGSGAGVRAAKIDDVFFIKLLCETVFRDKIVPSIHQQRAKAKGNR